MVTEELSGNVEAVEAKVSMGSRNKLLKTRECRRVSKGWGRKSVGTKRLGV
jgi:hypothetical protein